MAVRNTVMLMSRKAQVVTAGDVRSDYPDRVKPRLTIEQHARISHLAQRMGISEEDVVQRLLAAAQPSFDRVVDAALRLMVLQLDANDGAHTGHSGH